MASSPLISTWPRTGIVPGQRSRRRRVKPGTTCLMLAAKLIGMLWFHRAEAVAATTTATDVIATMRQLQQPPPTAAAQESTNETTLAPASCNAVGQEFVCEINMGLQGHGFSVMVDAALTCPRIENATVMNWTNLDTTACQCLAAMSYASITQQPKQCPCQYCSDSESGTSGPLSIDCSNVAPDPYIEGTCKHLACNGTCLDGDLTATTANDNKTTTASPNTNSSSSNVTTTNSTPAPSNTVAASVATTTIPPTVLPSTLAPATTTPSAAATTTPPTSPPPTTPSGNNVTVTIPSTKAMLPWWIPAAFYITNSRGDTATKLMDDPDSLVGLQQAFAVMVEEIVQDMSVPTTTTLAPIVRPTTTTTTTTAKWQPSATHDKEASDSTARHRWLENRYLQDAASILHAPAATALYHIQDASTCPGGITGPCQIVYGRYLLLLDNESASNNVVKADVSEEHKVATVVAIDAGRLQALLNDKVKENAGINPAGITVASADSVAVTPFHASGKCSLCLTGEKAPTDAMFPIAAANTTTDSGFECQTVSDLYAQQTSDDCLNYASAGLLVKLPADLKEFVTMKLPIDYAAHCGCPLSSLLAPAEDANPNPLDSVTVLGHPTCPAFCPNNKQVPVRNLNIMIDPGRGLTCGILETYGNAVADWSYCEAVARHGALCCTASTDTSPPAFNETADPTSSPTQNGTKAVTIPSYFRVYSVNGLSAEALMVGPEYSSMQRSYAAFVSRVVMELMQGGGDDNTNANTNNTSNNDLSRPLPLTDPADSNTTRYLRRSLLEQKGMPQISHRRQLQSVLDIANIQVHSFNNTNCSNTIPQGALCSTVNASYDLILLEQDNSTMLEDYTNYTQDAIDRGLLNETMEAMDPYSWLVVIGSEPFPPHLPPVRVKTGKELAEEGGYDEYWTIGIGVSVAITVITLVIIVCASDMGGHDHNDNDSVDPWEKQQSTKNIKAKEKAPSPQKKGDSKLPPKTQRQEYEMYRAQVEKLLDQKSPEEHDNIDDLMDLFYERELVLIAILKNMPDCPEHLMANSAEEEEVHHDDDEEYEEDVVDLEDIEGARKMPAGQDMNNTATRFEDSMFWASDDGSSGEFAEESNAYIDPSNGTDDAASFEDEDDKERVHRTIEEEDENAAETDTDTVDSGRKQDTDGSKSEHNEDKADVQMSGSMSDNSVDSAKKKDTEAGGNEDKDDSPVSDAQVEDKSGSINVESGNTQDASEKDASSSRVQDDSSADNNEAWDDEDAEVEDRKDNKDEKNEGTAPPLSKNKDPDESADEWDDDN